MAAPAVGMSQDFLYVPLQETSAEGHGAIRVDPQQLPDAEGALGPPGPEPIPDCNSPDRTIIQIC